MGPFVPELISPELDLVLAILLGIAFGFVLEQAGFSSCRKLTGLFYATDFTVLRVFFTAGATAMSGVFLLSHYGLLDMDVVYINPTFVQSAILGGAIMGLGFVLGGYCPGTSVCAAAVGKLDAMVFIVGGVFGILIFGEAYPRVVGIYTASSYGDLLASDALGISQGVFAAALIVIAIAAFVATTWIEKKVNPESESRRFPHRLHRIAAAVALVFGLFLAAMPDRKTSLLNEAADPAWQRSHPVARITPDELALRMVNNEPHLLPVDVRDPAQFAKMSLPGAANIQPATMFGKQWRDLLTPRQTRKIFFAQDEAAAVKAATLAELLGFRNVAVLQGGLDGFNRTILQATPPPAGLPESEVVPATFRARAAVRIAALIKERGGVKPVRQIKKVQGGCGS